MAQGTTVETSSNSSYSEVTSLIECNDQPYDWFSYTIRVLLMVPVLIFGFAANAMNLLIFRQKRMRTSMVNWYLVALAITDTGVLLSSFCMLSLPVICEDLDSLTLFNLGVGAQRWTYALGLTCQTASVGMTLLVSAHRFLGVCFPFKAQHWCTYKRVKAAIWIVATFSIAFNAPRWFEIAVDSCQSTVYNTTATRLVLTDLRLDNLYYNAYMVILYTLFMFAIPFFLLIIMNALIVRTVHQSYRLRQLLTNKTSYSSPNTEFGDATELTPHSVVSRRYSPQHAKTADADDANSGSASNAKENKTTIMLIAVVFMFLLCNSLAFINNILEVLIAHGVPILQTYLTTVELSNFLIVINSASNIFIYWAFSARYRLLFRRHISYLCYCLGIPTPVYSNVSPKRHNAKCKNSPSVSPLGKSPNRQQEKYLEEPQWTSPARHNFLGVPGEGQESKSPAGKTSISRSGSSRGNAECRKSPTARSVNSARESNLQQTSLLNVNGYANGSPSTKRICFVSTL